MRLAADKTDDANTTQSELGETFLGFVCLAIVLTFRLT